MTVRGDFFVPGQLDPGIRYKVTVYETQAAGKGERFEKGRNGVIMQL